MHTAKMVTHASGASGLESCVEFAVQYLRSDQMMQSTASMFDDSWRLEQVLQKNGSAASLEEAIRTRDLRMIGKSIEIRTEKEDFLLAELMSLVTVLRSTSGCVLIDGGESLRLCIGFEGTMDDDDSEDEELAAAVSSLLFDPTERPHCRLEGASILRFSSIRALQLHLLALTDGEGKRPNVASIALVIDSHRSDKHRIERMQHDIAKLRKQVKKQAITQQRQEIEALRDKLKADKNKRICSLAALRRRQAQEENGIKNASNYKTKESDENSAPLDEEPSVSVLSHQKTATSPMNSPEKKPLEQHHSPPIDHLDQLFPPPLTASSHVKMTLSDVRTYSEGTSRILNDNVDPSKLVECIRNASNLEKSLKTDTPIHNSDTKTILQADLHRYNAGDHYIDPTVGSLEKSEFVSPLTADHHSTGDNRSINDFRKDNPDISIADPVPATDGVEPLVYSRNLLDMNFQPNVQEARPPTVYKFDRPTTAKSIERNPSAYNVDTPFEEQDTRPLSAGSLERPGRSTERNPSAYNVDTPFEEQDTRPLSAGSLDRSVTTRSTERIPTTQKVEIPFEEQKARPPTAASLDRLMTARSTERIPSVLSHEEETAFDEYVARPPTAASLERPGISRRMEHIPIAGCLEKSPIEKYSKALEQLYPQPSNTAEFAPNAGRLEGRFTTEPSPETIIQEPIPTASYTKEGSCASDNNKVEASEQDILDRLDKQYASLKKEPVVKKEDSYVQAALAAYSTSMAIPEGEEQVDLLASIQSEDAYSFGVRLYDEIRDQTLGDVNLAASISAPPPPSRQERATTAPSKVVPPPIPITSATPTSSLLAEELWYVSSLEQPQLNEAVFKEKKKTNHNAVENDTATNTLVLASVPSLHAQRPETDTADKNLFYGEDAKSKTVNSVDDDLVLTAHREFVQSEAVADLAAVDEDEILATALAADGGFLRQKVAAVDAKAKEYSKWKADLKLPRVTPSGWAATIDVDPIKFAEHDLAKEKEGHQEEEEEVNGNDKDTVNKDGLDKMQRFQMMRAKRARAMEERRRLEKEHRAAIRAESFGGDEVPVLAVHRRGPPHRPRGAPTRKLSNKRTIHNALSQVCLAGAHCAAALDDALSALEASPADNHILLLKDDAVHVFRGLFAVHRGGTATTASAGANAAVQVEKIYGRGPSRFGEEHIQSFYKYNSASRSFQKLPAKSFTFTTDAIVLTPKASSGKGGAASFKARAIPTY
uniref:CKK domain-containing protein n=1 Tax=Aureoumbra lagunensis TaxID=44058 RepID=A0A7S3K3P9_9STRA